MTYVISDLHGEYEKYKKLLDAIAFSDDDTLYVLGDVVDRGEHPAAILRDMSRRANVVPMLGNHELMAVPLLKKLCVEITEENYETQLDEASLEALFRWNFNGGQTTLEDFRRLSPDEREELIAYMEDFSIWEELTVGENRFLLVHGGIPKDKLALPMEAQELGELMWERVDYSMRYFEDMYLVTGHTPTIHIGKEYDGRIYVKNGHIAIDCGAVYGKPLGCIRLDDFETFYVK